MVWSLAADRFHFHNSAVIMYAARRPFIDCERSKIDTIIIRNYYYLLLKRESWWTERDEFKMKCKNRLRRITFEKKRNICAIIAHALFDQHLFHSIVYGIWDPQHFEHFTREKKYKMNSVFVCRMATAVSFGERNLEKEKIWWTTRKLAAEAPKQQKLRGSIH